LTNRNELLRERDWITGVKTGHTQRAGWVLVGSGRKRGVTLVSVVLGTASEAARKDDTVELLEWGFDRYRRHTAVREGEVLESAPIAYRRGAELELVAGRTVRRTIRKGRRMRLRLREVPARVAGPIRRGQRLGSAEVLLRGRRIAEVPLVAAASVPDAGLAQQAKDSFTKPQWLLAAVAALGVGAFLAGQRRRPRRRRGAGGEPEVA
jgi:D-alanyl-D-alanine carboxypeptidase (penicillin-binding protein 5/6)